MKNVRVGIKKLKKNKHKSRKGETLEVVKSNDPKFEIVQSTISELCV